MNKLELVRIEVDAILIAQEDASLRHEGFVHLYGVAQNCSILAIKRGLEVELCTIIGMLHDIYTYKCGYQKNHGELGVEIAEEILRKINAFSEIEINIVKNAIKNHSDKKNVHDKYSELIKDADLLQNSIYNVTVRIKHKLRLKSVLKSIGIKMKLKTENGVDRVFLKPS